MGQVGSARELILPGIALSQSCRKYSGKYPFPCSLGGTTLRLIPQGSPVDLSPIRPSANLLTHAPWIGSSGFLISLSSFLMGASWDDLQNKPLALKVLFQDRIQLKHYIAQWKQTS